MFENHIAKYTKYNEHLETLEWKDPKTSCFAVWFVRQYGTLMVHGDLGCATYRWYPDMKLKNMANTNLDYFVSKCEASPIGRSPYNWTSFQCEKDLNEYFARDDEEIQKEKKQFEWHEGWQAISEDEHVWIDWLREKAHYVFGQDYWEHPVTSFGKELQGQIRLQHDALRMAFEQMLTDEKN